MLRILGGLGGGFLRSVTQGVEGALVEPPLGVSSSIEDPFEDIPDSSRVVSPSAKYNGPSVSLLTINTF